MSKMQALRERRQNRLRHKIKKHSYDKLRLTVFRSGRHMYAQIIDDRKGVTLVSASTLQKSVIKDLKSGSNVAASKIVGSILAERAKKVGIDVVVFDRGGYRYHGRVKAIAEAARLGGLRF